MFSIKENNEKCYWLILIVSFICFANALGISYNCYNKKDKDPRKNQSYTDIFKNRNKRDENEIEAIVKEIKMSPYSAIGFEPYKAFPLLIEVSNIQGNSDKSPIGSTTEKLDFSTTTQEYAGKTTIINNIGNDNINESNSEKVNGAGVVLVEIKPPQTPYPIIPRDIKDNSPYPASGYRPSKPFFLPSEQLQFQDGNRQGVSPTINNSEHPACGSSTNPLAPKPLGGGKENPDSELININNKT